MKRGKNTFYWTYIVRAKVSFVPVFPFFYEFFPKLDPETSLTKNKKSGLENFYFATIGWMNQDRHMKKPNNVDCNVVYLHKNKLQVFQNTFLLDFLVTDAVFFLLLWDLFVHSNIYANYLYDFFGIIWDLLSI